MDWTFLRIYFIVGECGGWGLSTHLFHCGRVWWVGPFYPVIYFIVGECGGWDFSTQSFISLRASVVGGTFLCSHLFHCG